VRDERPAVDERHPPPLLPGDEAGHLDAQGHDRDADEPDEERAAGREEVERRLIATTAIAKPSRMGEEGTPAGGVDRRAEERAGQCTRRVRVRAGGADAAVGSHPAAAGAARQGRGPSAQQAPGRRGVSRGRPGGRQP
jgi:hypothetical protein